MEDGGFGFVGCFVLGSVGGLGFVLCWLAKKKGWMVRRCVACVSDTQDSDSYIHFDRSKRRKRNFLLRVFISAGAHKRPYHATPSGNVGRPQASAKVLEAHCFTIMNICSK